ncbi:hypothetical protein [Priestia flexa]|uniref:hypothetical protein n=1 Tax=Priestia flexa TaxID=86664 RepID=UPI0024920B76|nr:hypothetical protein [Priestia flexa]
MFGKNHLNVEYGNVKVTDVATKVGSLFGSKGREVGKKVDQATKKITIKIDK